MLMLALRQVPILHQLNPHAAACIGAPRRIAQRNLGLQGPTPTASGMWQPLMEGEHSGRLLACIQLWVYSALWYSMHVTIVFASLIRRSSVDRWHYLTLMFALCHVQAPWKVGERFG